MTILHPHMSLQGGAVIVLIFGGGAWDTERFIRLSNKTPFGSESVTPGSMFLWSLPCVVFLELLYLNIFALQELNLEFNFIDLFVHNILWVTLGLYSKENKTKDRALGNPATCNLEVKVWGKDCLQGVEEVTRGEGGGRDSVPRRREHDTYFKTWRSREKNSERRHLAASDARACWEWEGRRRVCLCKPGPQCDRRLQSQWRGLDGI